VSKIVFDEPAWWRRPAWQAIAAALLALAAWLIWWTALAPVDHDPIVVRAPAATTPRTQARPAAVPTPPPQPVPLGDPPSAAPDPAAASPDAARAPAEADDGESEPDDTAPDRTRP
jgi:hypothetical protein